MPKILIPTALRPLVDNNRAIGVDAETVSSALKQLVAQYPNMEHQLFSQPNKLVSFLNVFVNDENIRDLNGIDSELAPQDEVLLVPAIAGG